MRILFAPVVISSRFPGSLLLITRTERMPPDPYVPNSMNANTDMAIKILGEKNYVFSTFSILKVFDLLTSAANFNTLPQDLPPATPRHWNFNSDRHAFESTDVAYIPECDKRRGQFENVFESATRFCNKNTAIYDINDLVEEKTEGKIRNLVPENTDTDFMIVANAVYFRSLWGNKDLFRDIGYRNFNGVRVPFMRALGVLKYVNNRNIKAVELPYRSPVFSAFIFSTESQNPIQTLNEVNWSEETIEVKMPKFEMEYRLKSEEAHEIASQMAPYYSLVDCNVYSDFNTFVGQTCKKPIEIIQKAYINVDAEASGWILESRYKRAQKITFDTSFYFVVKKWGEPILISRVVDPKNTKEDIKETVHPWRQPWNDPWRQPWHHPYLRIDRFNRFNKETVDLTTVNRR